MNVRNTLTKEDRWLAAEYALGVLNQTQMRRAEERFQNDRAFRAEVEGWNNQLSPMLEEVADVNPPSAVWQQVEKSIAPAAPAVAPTSVVESGIGFWKMMTAFASTAAVGCFAFLMYTTGGDFAGSELKSVKDQLASVQQSFEAKEAQLAESQGEATQLQEQIAALSSASDATEQALSDSREALASAEAEIAAVQSDLQASQTELADVRDRIARSNPLVASLTQSGDAPAFVAQYDPLKQALLIRTSVTDTDEKVPEIWLIPDQGDRKGEVLSLGVMDESAPDTVQISDDFLPLIGEGGTLAITMEPPGGAPNGVATGPVIALGKLQSL
ncbi:MAG: anti-sigma factor [Rhizobiaceae bacterium]|nr:anti-sigma factor [Rhizobiaceae bacterium]